MKKLFKLFGLMIITSTLFCLSSCGNIFGNKSGDDEVINHDFVIAPNGKDITTQQFIYYVSTTIFSYQGYEKCYYQINFNRATKSWRMFTRAVASETPITDIASGTYGEDKDVIINGGTLVLTDADDAQYSQTVTIVKAADGTLSFNANVAPAHKSIGAKDAK